MCKKSNRPPIVNGWVVYISDVSFTYEAARIDNETHVSLHSTIKWWKNEKLIRLVANK